MNTNLFYKSLTNVKTKNHKDDLFGRIRFSELSSTAPSYILSFFLINAFTCSFSALNVKYRF